MDYRGNMEGRLVNGVERLYLTVDVMYASLCPCSKEISDYGAHNQRSVANVTVGASLSGVGRLGNAATSGTFVTGADGFIGSHLVESLVGAGYKVRALSLYNSFGNRGWLDHLPNEILREVDAISGDIRDHDYIFRSKCKQNINFFIFCQRQNLYSQK